MINCERIVSARKNRAGVRPIQQNKQFKSEVVVSGVTD